MKRPKTGTVTFLFTDLEGSTGLAHRLKERWSTVLVEHRRLIRQPALSSGGRHPAVHEVQALHRHSRIRDARPRGRGLDARRRPLGAPGSRVALYLWASTRGGL